MSLLGFQTYETAFYLCLFFYFEMKKKKNLPSSLEHLYYSLKEI